MTKTAPKRAKSLDPLLLQLFPSDISKGDERKAQIIQAVIDVVAREGFESLTFERIGKQIGISKSHVVYHFKDKNEILLKAYEYILSFAQTHIIESLSDEEEGYERLKAYIQAHFEWMKRKPTHFPFIVMIYGKSIYDKEMRRFNRQVRTAGRNRVYALVKEDERIPKELHPSLATLLHDLITGCLIELVTYFGNSIPEKIKEERLKTLLFQTRMIWESARKDF